MKKITESDIELLAIEQLEKLSCHYFYASYISLDSEARNEVIKQIERTSTNK